MGAGPSGVDVLALTGKTEASSPHPPTSVGSYPLATRSRRAPSALASPPGNLISLDLIHLRQMPLLTERTYDLPASATALAAPFDSANQIKIDPQSRNTNANISATCRLNTSAISGPSSAPIRIAPF